MSPELLLLAAAFFLLRGEQPKPAPKYVAAKRKPGAPPLTSTIRKPTTTTRFTAAKRKPGGPAIRAVR